MFLDLHFNQNKTYRDISKIAKMSLRDIGEIINNARKEKERQEHKSISVQAYELFSKDKTPLEAAIALNIGQTQATQYYAEYLKLVGLEDITKLYIELKGDTSYFVNLCKAARSAKMEVRHVIKLIDIANNDLPTAEYTYEQLQKKVDLLKIDNRRLEREIEYLNEQITSTRITLHSIIQDSDREMTRFLDLQKRTAKQEAIVKHFENDNEEYVKIGKTVRDKVHATLSNVRTVLELALLSLIESMKNEPDKYNSLIYYDKESLSTNRQRTSSHGYGIEDYKATLIDQAEKLYAYLADRFIGEVLNEYASRTPSSGSGSPLPALQLEDDRQQQEKSSLS